MGELAASMRSLLATIPYGSTAKHRGCPDDFASRRPGLTTTITAQTRQGIVPYPIGTALSSVVFVACDRTFD